MRRDQAGVIVVAAVSLLLLALAGASVPYEQQFEEIEPPDEPPEDDGDDREELVDGQSGFSAGTLLGIGFAVVATALVVAWLLFRSRPAEAESSTPPSPVDPPDVDEPPLEAVAAAAGDAAERIRQTDSLENEVYRAWWEMTRALRVSNPRTKTPGEFARAATRAGMAPADVRELTDLFTDVRYGDRALTEDDEQRAVAILESIEATYRREPS